MAEPKFIDDPTVREIYAEAVQTLFGAPGILRIELSLGRWTQQPPVHMDRIVPVGRFALPYEVARVLRDQLVEAIERVDQGPSPAVGPAKAN